MKTENINFMTGILNHYFSHCEQKEADCFTHDYFNSGDYSGCAVEVANRKVLLENTELCERLGLELLSENYSSKSILFPIAALQDQEIQEIFKGLNDYPCLNYEAVSEVEIEMEQECWDLFGRDDFKKHLESQIGLDTETITDAQVDSIYQNASQETNYNIFEVESGTSGYFNFESFGGLYEKQTNLLKRLSEEKND